MPIAGGDGGDSGDLTVAISGDHFYANIHNAYEFAFLVSASAGTPGYGGGGTGGGPDGLSGQLGSVIAAVDDNVIRSFAGGPGEVQLGADVKNGNSQDADIKGNEIALSNTTGAWIVDLTRTPRGAS